MPTQGGRAGRAVVALAMGTALWSILVAPALPESTTTDTSSPSSYQAECSGGTDSTQGYPDASPAVAADLFTTSFPCLLDPVAANSAAPLMTTDQTGETVPVDLSLTSTGDSFQPAAPLVDLTLPADLGDQVSFGDQGIAIDPGATDPQAAAAASAELLADGEGLFYAEVATSTDVALAPLSHGLQATYQLRAPESPEHLQIALTLPDGASLQAAGHGGASVVDGDQVLADISPPLAFDAAGNPVDATLSVTDDSLEVDLPESDPSVAYPIAVTTMVSSSSTNAPASDAAAVIPKLGYNTIQLENAGDLNGNYDKAIDGNATWFRGGPGMMEDRRNQNAYVFRADGAGLNTLYVIAPPGTDIDGDNSPDVPTGYSGYQTYCANLATNKSYVDAFEIMNEPNTLVNVLDIQTTGAQTYALYAASCKLGIQSVRPNVPILAASTDRGTHGGLTWYDWLNQFGYYTQDSAPDLIISSHIYPSGDDLSAPTYAASAVQSDVALDLIYADWTWGVNHDLWITETGIQDQNLAAKRNLIYPGPAVCGADYKPKYLKQMFLKAGDNNAYDVHKVFVYRFTRNDQTTATTRPGCGIRPAIPTTNTSTAPRIAGFPPSLPSPARELAASSA